MLQALTRNTGQHRARQPEVGMVEDVEKLGVEPQFHPLRQWEPFRDVEIIPEKIGGRAKCSGRGSQIGSSEECRRRCKSR